VKFFQQRPWHQVSGLMFPTLARAPLARALLARALLARALLARALVLSWCLISLSAGEASQPSDTPPKPATEPAGEVKPADPNPAALRLQPALISVSAKQGGMMSFNEQEPSKLLGGVRLGYEEVFVLCDHVDYWQSKLLGVKRATLDHALIASGPNAEEPDHVVFDSRATKLPQISFRGLMRPREVEIIRQPLAPQDQARLEARRAREVEEQKARAKAGADSKSTPKADANGEPTAGKGDATVVEPTILVRFRVLMHQFGDFTGDLKTTDGWSPHFGWAEEAEVTVVCDVLPEGIANPRFSAIDLKGRPAGEGVDKRPARLGRKHIPLVGAAVQKQFDAEAYDWWAESSHITVEFDDLGRVLRIKTGADYRGQGTPSLDTPVQTPEAVPPAKP